MRSDFGIRQTLCKKEPKHFFTHNLGSNQTPYVYKYGDIFIPQLKSSFTNNKNVTFPAYLSIPDYILLPLCPFRLYSLYYVLYMAIQFYAKHYVQSPKL